MCTSLGVNSSLTYLDLSYNAIGPEGGIALGAALQDNKVLRSLLLANNAIDSTACMTICAGIVENEALEEISFNQNPIAVQGVKVIMVRYCSFSLLNFVMSDESNFPNELKKI